MVDIPDYVKKRTVIAYICTHSSHTAPQGFLSIQELRKHLRDEHSEPNSTDWSQKV